MEIFLSIIISIISSAISSFFLIKIYLKLTIRILCTIYSEIAVHLDLGIFQRAALPTSSNIKTLHYSARNQPVILRNKIFSRYKTVAPVQFLVETELVVERLESAYTENERCRNCLYLSLKELNKLQYLRQRRSVSLYRRFTFQLTLPLSRHMPCRLEPRDFHTAVTCPSILPCDLSDHILCVKAHSFICIRLLFALSLKT